MRTCIAYIENHGLYKEPRGNFLSRISEGWLIFILGAITTIFFFFGNLYAGLQNVDLKQANKQQADSLVLYRQRIDSLSAIKAKPDTVAKPKTSPADSATHK